MSAAITLQSPDSTKWDLTVDNNGILTVTSGSSGTVTSAVLQSPDSTKWDIRIDNNGIVSGVSGSTGTITSMILDAPNYSQWGLSIENSGLIDVASLGIYAPTIGDTEDMLDSYFTVQKPLMMDVADNQDLFFKKMFPVFAETCSISEAVSNLLATLITDGVIPITDIFAQLPLKFLSFVDSADISDILVKLMGTSIADLLDLSDVLTRAQGVSALDREDVSESFQPFVIKTLFLTEISDYLDNLIKTIGFAPQDQVDISDQSSKSQRVTMADNEDVGEAISILRTLLAALDTVDFSDSVSPRIDIKGLTFLDTADLLDVMSRMQGMSILDQEDLQDEILKSLYSTMREQVDLLESLTITKLISLALSELGDIADTMVKSLSLITNDDSFASDDLARLIYKLMIDQEDVFDVATPFARVAGYIDTTMSGSTDLMKRIDRVLRGLNFTAGTKGNVR